MDCSKSARAPAALAASIRLPAASIAQSRSSSGVENGA
jgi:hypothetical protein